METIIGLLFLLLPVIFKLIGKRMEQSGNLDQAKKMRDIYEAFGGDTEERQEEILPVEEGEPIQFSDFEVEVKPLPVNVTPVAEVRTIKAAPVRLEEAPKAKPILMEEAEEKKDKIDPKKLVIYSEIMKTKF